MSDHIVLTAAGFLAPSYLLESLVNENDALRLSCPGCGETLRLMGVELTTALCILHLCCALCGLMERWTSMGPWRITPDESVLAEIADAQKAGT